MSHEDAYELERQRIIKENLALLESLGLGGNSINNHNVLKPKHSSSSSSKRPALAKRTSSRSSTRLKRESTAGTDSPLRRSARNVGRDQKTPGTARPVVRHQRRLSDFIVDDDEDDSHLKQRTGEGLGKGVALARLHNPKQFGSIPDVPVGKAWPLRAGASMDSIHAPLVACISGNPTVGAWSVCFSGGYEDNIDLGESFVLTGAGGRDLKGNGKNLRTAEQSFDQSFEHAMNGALKRSSETGKPVRVVRGYKTDSEWAPLEGESTRLPVLSSIRLLSKPCLYSRSSALDTLRSSLGYRYDGLYKVTSARLIPSSVTGYKVCTFQFKRLPRQPPIPRRSDVVEEETGGDVEMQSGTVGSRPGSKAGSGSGSEAAELDEVDELALGPIAKLDPAPAPAIAPVSRRYSTRTQGPVLPNPPSALAIPPVTKRYSTRSARARP